MAEADRKCLFPLQDMDLDELPILAFAVIVAILVLGLASMFQPG
jgi:hypothetical protein